MLSAPASQAIEVPRTPGKTLTVDSNTSTEPAQLSPKAPSPSHLHILAYKISLGKVRIVHFTLNS